MRNIGLLVFIIWARAAHAAPGALTFLREGTGARWLGLGAAARAAADDVHAAYWNPSSLTAAGPVVWQAGMELGVESQGRSTYALAGSLQTDAHGSYALTWLRRSTADLERVDDQGTVTAKETAADDAILVSGGWAPWYALRAGLTAKLLHESLLGYAATGGALDLGLRWQPFLDTDLSMGATAENLAGTLSWNSGRSDRPARALAGALAWRTWQQRLLLAADVVSRQDAGTELHAGAELWPIPLAAIRAGWNAGHPTIGASYAWKPYRLDYAFVFDSAAVSTRHLVSFLLTF